MQTIIISAINKDKKDWDKKINSVAKIPDINALLAYKKRVENIEIEDEK